MRQQPARRGGRRPPAYSSSAIPLPLFSTEDSQVFNSNLYMSAVQETTSSRPNTVTYESALDTLHSMFGSFDRETLEMILQSNRK
jgi:hypothetical protein